MLHCHRFVITLIELFKSSRWCQAGPAESGRLVGLSVRCYGWEIVKSMGAAIPVLSLIPSLVVPQRYTLPLFDQHGVDKLGSNTNYYRF